MQEVAHNRKRSSRFDNIDRELHFKQLMDNLETENRQLKGLIVRLSETILKNVATQR